MPNSVPLAKLNKDALMVVIVIWMLMFLTFGLLTTRRILCIRWKRKYGWDDAFLAVAAVLGTFQTFFTSRAGHHGLGYYIRSSNVVQLQLFAKFMYASDLVFIVVLAASKLSLVCLIQRIVLDRSFIKRVAPIMYATIGLWTVFSVLSLAFQCRLPMPWLYAPSNCAGSGALWYPILLTSVFINVFISGAALSERRKIPLGGRQAKVTTILFTSRFSVCLITIAQLAILAPALHSDYQSKAMVIPTILKQSVMNLSIWTAAIPVLYKPLATLSPNYPEPAAEKSSVQLSPSGSSRSAQKSTLSHWRTGSSASWSSKTMENKGRTDATNFQSLPRLTLSFNAFNPESERRSRSRFSECFSHEKNTRNSMTPEEQIIRQTLDSKVESESKRQIATSLRPIQQPLRTYQP